MIMKGMIFMLCTHCKKEQATFFYTQNINGSETSVALCDKCAKKAGVNLHTSSMLSPLFSSFFDIPESGQTLRDHAKKCGLCALTFDDILSLGKVGCPECYNTFREELKNTIRSIHGTAKHSGLSPSNENTAATAPKKETSKEDQLRAELETAIKNENYEEAVKLRDQIKKLKEEK